MRILFLTQFFPPEVGAPQTRILETATNLQAQGHEVFVLTTFPNYPSGVIPTPYRGRLFMRERWAGVPVLRAWLYAAPNRGFLRRILCHASFAATALLASFRLPRRLDIICVDMHPIFLCFTAYLIGRLRRAPYVLNAGDLIPDQAVAVGALTNPLAIAVTRRLADFVCRHAALVVPFTRGIGEILASRGVAAQRLEVIHYGASLSLFEQAPPTALPEQLERALTDRFVVTYAGTHGLSQGLESVLRAADLLRAQPEIHFLLVGDGAEKPALVALAQQLALPNVTFLDPVPHKTMPELYRRSATCLVSLRAEGLLQRIGLPSKLFEIMAAGRPVLLAMGGEPADIVRAAHAGLVVPSESPAELAHAVHQLQADPTACTRYGENGRRYITEHLTRERQSRRYEAALARVVHGRQQPDEAVRIRAVYQGYDSSPRQQAKRDPQNQGNRRIAVEREQIERDLLRTQGLDLGRAEVLDVGCGSGGHIGELLAWGAQAGHCHGVDLLPDRIAAARERFPEVDFAIADARHLIFSDARFDLAICSTLFSSILDRALARQVAQEIGRVLKPGGVVLWYDSRVPNPWNPNVRGYRKGEVRALFPGWASRMRSLTLIPPLAPRRLGPLLPVLYPALAALPPLRVRYAGVLQKPVEEE